MCRIITLLAATSLVAGIALAAPAEEDRVGIGVQVGDPTALSGKVYLTEQHAIDVSIAYAPERIGPWHNYVHAVYLLHPSKLVEGRVADLTWHVGAGGVAVTDQWNTWPAWQSDDFGVGLRTPVGINLNLQEVPLQFTAEVAGNTFVFPDLGFALGGNLGAHVFF